MTDWFPVEKAAKSPDGKYQAYSNGKWNPVDKVAKNADGQYMAYSESKPSEKADESKVNDMERRHKFDLGSVGESGLAGAGIGGAIGAIGGPAGALGGAAIGGASGLLSGVAGETARTLGASEPVAIASELVGGGLEGGIRALGRGAYKIAEKGLLGYHSRRALEESVKLGEEFVSPKAAMSEAEKIVKGKELGIPAKKIKVEQTVNQDVTQNQLKSDLQKVGIVAKTGEKASDSVRNHLYSGMTELKDSGKPFITSPEYLKLVDDLSVNAVRPGGITKEQMKSITQTLSNQVSKHPKLSQVANEDILGLIQNSGRYVEGKIVKDIPDEAANLIRQRFNQYLESNGKGKAYDALKSVESKEFVASTKDKLPTMVREGFKNIRGEEFSQDMLNIKNGGPEAQKMLTDSIKLHFYNVDPSKFQGEFNRIASAIKKTETQAISDKVLDHIQETLLEIPKNIPKEKMRLLQQQIIKSSLIGATSAELSQNQ